MTKYCGLDVNTVLYVREKSFASDICCVNLPSAKLCLWLRQYLSACQLYRAFRSLAILLCKRSIVCSLPMI